MVDVQDGDAHPHKRTAIPQLLNPVSSSPTKRQEEHPHATHRGALQRPSSSPGARSDLTRSGLPPTAPPTFHLRAAQWEPADSSPPNTVHHNSFPETNGGVRERSASYPTFDSGPRSNDGSGYMITASSNPVFCHPQGMGNPPSPAPYALQQQQVLFFQDGRVGEHSDNSELYHHSLIVQGA